MWGIPPHDGAIYISAVEREGSFRNSSPPASITVVSKSAEVLGGGSCDWVGET